MKNNFIRDHIRDINPYEPVIPMDVLSEQLEIPIHQLVKLDANENPYGMPPKAKKRLVKLKFGHIYPDPESRKLRQALSEFLKVPFEHVLAGSGADELIDLIFRLSFSPGDKVIDCPPTFGFYSAVAKINDLKIIRIKRKEDFSIDINGIERAISEGAKGIFLANPNNPDGSLISTKVIDRLLELPLLVVIDEAYIEFAPFSASRTHEVLSRENLIVLRTFSKWGGVAGLRLGYGIFPINYLNELLKIKQPYNVSLAAQEAGLGALEDIKRLNRRLGCIIAERTRLVAALEKITWLQTYPTHANFILCKVLGKDALLVKKKLYALGILIRYFNDPELKDFLRISVGRPHQTDYLIRKLREL